MSYHQALLRRWSRRDWFAIVVVALAVAFLTGAGLLVDATGTRTIEFAAEQGTPLSVTWDGAPDSAQAAASDAAVTLPVAQARIDGRPATVVGLPSNNTTLTNDTAGSIPPPPPNGTVRHRTADRTVRLEGPAGTVNATVRPTTRSVLPPDWYTARPDTVRQVGMTDAVTLAPDNGDTPLQGVLPFFLIGARGSVHLVGLLAVGAGILLGVVVYGVSRLTVQDRQRTIRIIRATGGTARTVVGLFAVRAAGLTAVGVALGYALGMILTNAAVSVAVFAGRPIALSTQLSGRLVAVLVPVYAGLILVGALGGLLAARPTATVPPRELAPTTTAAAAGDVAPPQQGSATLRDRLGLDLLGWQTVLPTATTLAVFLVVAVVAVSTYGMLAPLGGTQQPTLTEPDASHPFASDVPVSYATELRAQGIGASPEILLLGVHRGQPYVARGANLTAFAQQTEARVVRGRPPDGPGEAVLGTDLARTLGLSVGDRLTMGGSTQPALTRVTITGLYAAQEPYDDQLLTALPAARHLAGVPSGTAHLVRVDQLPTTEQTASVVGVDTPARVPAGEAVPVAVTVANPTATTQSQAVTVAVGDREQTVTATVEPGQQRTVVTNVSTDTPGTVTVTVANMTREVRVVSTDALQIAAVPDTAPPGSAPLVRVETATGTPVANATVAVGQTTRRTDAAGWVRVPLADTGEARLIATAGDRQANTTITVTQATDRRLRATLTLSPNRPTVASSPTAEVRLRNPWTQSLTREVSVVGPNRTTTATVQVAPNETATLSASLSRRPPGRYSVTVDSREMLTTAAYTVVGDPRLAASVAATGEEAASSGFARAARTLFGNLGVLVGVLLLLAGLMTVGATTAAFAGAVSTRRRTLGIHRAMGASPWQILRLVLADALRIATVATLLAVVLAGGALWVLDATEVLTVYGMRLASMGSPTVVLAGAIAALTLALLGATAATWRVVRTSPAALLAGRRATPPPDGDGPLETAGGRSGDAVSDQAAQTHGRSPDREQERSRPSDHDRDDREREDDSDSPSTTEHEHVTADSERTAVGSTDHTQTNDHDTEDGDNA